MIRNLKLVIGDKNLSSWSMRAWLVAKASGLDFEEILVPLDQPESKAALEKYSPSGRVPCLVHDDLRIWDSLAIAEYLAELSPHKKLWPVDPTDRALARSYSAEMHSGFSNVRSQLSMDIRLKMEIRHLIPSTISEIDRIIYLWSEALKKSGGPFLFGEFGIVDAFYAPVVFRFNSYGIKIQSEAALRYMKVIQDQSFVRSWAEAGRSEIYSSAVFK